MPFDSEIFIEPVQEARDAEIEVKKWFEGARLRGSAGINLYFAPYNKAFHKLSKEVRVYGHSVGLVEYDERLYRKLWGSGDSNEEIWYIGRIKGRKVGNATR